MDVLIVRIDKRSLEYIDTISNVKYNHIMYIVQNNVARVDRTKIQYRICLRHEMISILCDLVNDGNKLYV